ncbi:uncharacterized protein LOC134741931 [Cydia strobilella]|uniref:uncharacterized protein LOC134741931 n=1 Tax=Cydia strobilella TaxID=1100964 RepID=UPI003006F113
MAVADAMFIFEVVVEHVRSLVDSRLLVIRSDFADIFSLELKDPKQMHIVIPEPLPLPPEPPGKKKKPPKPKKPKKGALPPPPPPEPVIQSGQSVLFTSSAEFLIKLMLKCPLQVTLWSKEDNLVFIGASVIPWDPMFLTYLQQIVNCQTPVPVTLNDEFNVFEENTAKLMAKIGLQIKLSYLGDKVTTAFRTLSEDPTVKKVLYTGINSKTTSYICTMKTTDEVFEENCNKVENSFVKDRPKPQLLFADYTNAPGANLVEFSEGDYCCMNNADKPPESKYTAPNTVPTIDFIIDYVRKIIASCNDNMRMLTPRPTITPKIRATDIDRLCYCKQSQWPESALAEKYKIEVQSGPCAVCAEPGKTGGPGGAGAEGPGAIFDIANIRGPCGKPDCKIARHIRKYIENLIEEDKIEVDINEIIGPCGSKLCTLAEKIQEFLRHEGMFSEGATKEGLSTQCACIQKMQDALAERKSCQSICSKDCEEGDDDPEETCAGKGCPFSGQSQRVYNVYYFTVELDQTSKSTSGKTTPVTDQTRSDEDKFKFCAKDCPSMKAETEITLCTKGVCPSANREDKPCPEHPCPVKGEYPPSPADSNVEIELDAIHNPCCSTTCDVAETVKDFIVDGLEKKKKINEKNDNECYCDCVCDFNFTKNTTYCAVCGGYECLGTDMENQPAFIKPLPCPVYHKLYDKKYIKTESPWPDEDHVETLDKISIKTTRSQKLTNAMAKKDSFFEDEGGEKEKKKTEKSVNKKKAQKSNVGVVKKVGKAEEQRPSKYPYPPVPANMGWNWTAEDIPGLKPRPNWKPGAAIKPLVRRYRAVRDGIDIIAKKKRALLSKKKKIESKPLLIVTKKDGEYTVQMEVFKKYSRERLLFQYPYEEKPPLIYSIGKTEEEKTKIQKQRERRERRETRRKCRLLQSTFRDKCQEICVKAYNQAIGILPLPNPNDPECPCYTKPADAISPPIDSCSCSEEGSISSSDTDGDDWIIEFSPPASKYDAKAKHPPTTAENESQYTYLDYRVKLLDKHGNQVPRYFKGPDGKNECSDLGGFWDHNHVWQEINKDGYIGPDGRWIPLTFIGPDGMMYSSEEGGFTDKDGNYLKLGVDGYVDKDGKWAWYSRFKSKQDKSKSNMTGKSKGKESPMKKTAATAMKQTKATATDAKAGKSGSGDAKAIPNKSNVKRTVSTKEPQKRTNYQVMTSMSANFDTAGRRFRRHSVKLPPLSNSSRAAEARKMARYQEILKPLEEYSDIALFKKPGRKLKTNRACNTPLRQRSPNDSFYECPGNMSQIRPVCSFENNTNTSIC